MQTARVRLLSTVLLLLASLLPAAAGAADPELGLADAVRQALESNLDLAARRRALAADREQIGIARSALLPQINVGARAQQLDDNRSDGNRGNSSQRSGTVAAGVTQVLYDESDWAGFDIQKQVYVQQQEQFEAFRIGLVQDAANSFLELDRTRALLDIQERNRELTARNLETSRARIAAGWSSEREVLRWESQLASNDTDVVQARTQVLVNRFELNRVRNRPPEAPITPLPAAIEEYGFVYARQLIVDAIADPEGDRRLRDLLVRVGLTRSPVLAAIDAALDAERRQLTADKRAFWVPSLSLGAGIDHLAVNSSSGGSDFNETEWTVGAELTFPLLQGGAKFARLRQARESLASLRIEHRAASETVDQSVRAAFAQASGSYAELGYTQKQESAARRNYELVNESYVLGVASILGLLDAQSQLLAANQAVTDALYGFLEDLIAAEEQIAFYPFLAPAPEVTELLDGFERQLRTVP